MLWFVCDSVSTSDPRGLQYATSPLDASKSLTLNLEIVKDFSGNVIAGKQTNTSFEKNQNK